MSPEELLVSSFQKKIPCLKREKGLFMVGGRCLKVFSKTESTNCFQPFSASRIPKVSISDVRSLQLKEVFPPHVYAGKQNIYAEDPDWRKLVLFYEYFHGDTGRGCGARYATLVTCLVIRKDPQ